MYYNWTSCNFAGPMLPGNENREIAENLEDRILPNDCFCYQFVDSWRDRVWTMLSDLVTDEVKREFRENPPEYVVSDNLSWLDDLIYEINGEVCNIKNIFANRLAASYRTFRAAHGTRTNDLNKFYKNGLRVLRANEIENLARLLFISERAKASAELRLKEAIDEIGARNLGGGRQGRTYFCADERNLTSRDGGAGHYLIYGSEYLFSLASRITSAADAKKTLKKIGRPTVFVCDIPTGLISQHTFREFTGLIIEYLFCELVDGFESHALAPGAGSALRLTTDLPAQHIVGHYHPLRIYDPLWSI